MKYILALAISLCFAGNACADSAASKLPVNALEAAQELQRGSMQFADIYQVAYETTALFFSDAHCAKPTQEQISNRLYKGRVFSKKGQHHAISLEFRHRDIVSKDLPPIPLYTITAFMYDNQLELAKYKLSNLGHEEYKFAIQDLGGEAIRETDSAYESEVTLFGQTGNPVKYHKISVKSFKKPDVMTVAIEIDGEIWYGTAEFVKNLAPRK